MACTKNQDSAIERAYRERTKNSKPQSEEEKARVEAGGQRPDEPVCGVRATLAAVTPEP